MQILLDNPMIKSSAMYRVSRMKFPGHSSFQAEMMKHFHIRRWAARRSIRVGNIKEYVI